MKQRLYLMIIAAAAGLISSIFGTLPTAVAVDYYVDSRTGEDTNDGLTPASAWKTLKRVNQAKDIVGGDRILFARGGLWRGVMAPHSGEPGKPVCYSAYGKGPLPKFYGSIEASSPNDWVEIKPNLWATQKIEPKNLGPINENQRTIQNDKTITVQGDGQWALHTEGGAQARLRQNGVGFRLECTKGSDKTNHIQIWGPSFNAPLPQGVLVSFRARCSKPYQMPMFAIQKSGFPWNGFFVGGGNVALTDQWQSFEMFLAQSKEVPDHKDMTIRYHLSIGGMPDDCVLDVELDRVCAASMDTSKLLYCDVGNIIFDHGNFKKYHRCGIKKWSIDDLAEPGQYYYNPKEKRVYLNWPNNPADDCDSIELALRTTIINQSNCHDIIYENLAVAYGAAHGFGGASTERLIIRHCDIYYIGGGHQFSHPNGRPVRFGNGIEFWNCCKDNLVEENRLWEIYDAALTNQGKGDANNKSEQIRVTYRKNLIWNSEYSFEFWNRDETQRTEDILFENNLCYDAGSGWAHGQRPDINGAHLMFYNNSSATKNFVVRNNIFSESTEVCLRMDSDWRSGLKMTGNQYWQSQQPIVRFLVKTYYNKEDLSKYQQETGLDTGSTIVEQHMAPNSAQ